MSKLGGKGYILYAYHPRAAILNPSSEDEVSECLYREDGNVHISRPLGFDEREHDFRKRKEEQ